MADDDAVLAAARAAASVAQLEDITRRMAKSKGAINLVKPGRTLLREGTLSKKGEEHTAP